MEKPDIPKNEIKRLKELNAYDIIGVAEDEDFDFLTSMAAEICDTKISLISLVAQKEMELKEVSLNEVCKITLDLLKDQVNESRAFISIPELPEVVGDKLQLVRLFQNLLDNAIKYKSDAAPQIGIGFEEKGDEITVFVRDNGIGFEQCFADQVFGFMKRLHTQDNISGTGLWLSACKRIVENHGGTIHAESAVGKGSTFYFTLPRLNSTNA